MRKLIFEIAIASLCILAPILVYAGSYEDGIAAQQQGKYAEAEAYFHEAGTAEAKLALGKLYYDGHGQYKDERYKFASANYFSAAKLGNGEAQYLLAKMYETGIGGEQSFAMAAEYYEQASKSGFRKKDDRFGFEQPGSLATSTRNAAMMETLADGALASGDYSDAFETYKTLADTHNHAKSQYMMARLFIAGKGVTHSKEKALALIKKAANNGYPDAQFHLGMLYAKGTGVTKSKGDAIVWFKKAKANGNKNAKVALKQLGVQ